MAPYAVSVPPNAVSVPHIAQHGVAPREHALGQYRTWRSRIGSSGPRGLGPTSALGQYRRSHSTERP
eukprot:1178-Rhodomonas_salina.2